jgi:hypothetical protein
MITQLEALHQINYIRIYTVFNNTLYSFYNLNDSQFSDLIRNI